jgi:sugar/nucleoside kinase (ribokinase family)
MPVQRRERHCGGLTATALVAAARLGSRCVYAGVLGDDELSQFVIDRFRQEGIETGYVCRRPGTRPVHATIIVDQSQNTRAILYDLEGAVGAEPDWPEEEVIRAGRVLFVDNIGVEGMIRAARLARQAGIPVVADLENDSHPRFAELLALADHPILSQDFAAKVTGRSDPAAAARALWTPERKAVAVTCGAAGCWYIDVEHPAEVVHQPAFAVEVVDTTGCGDVFHGAYASALARGLDTADRIRFASAAAALKATRPGGQAGIPSRPAVEAFLQQRGGTP